MSNITQCVGTAARFTEPREAAGTFSDAWGALGAYLNTINLPGSTLYGQMPSDWGVKWANVTSFKFSDARMHSSLPPEWGSGFPSLLNMLLQNIPGLYGGPFASSWPPSHAASAPVPFLPLQNTPRPCRLCDAHRASHAKNKAWFDAQCLHGPHSDG